MFIELLNSNLAQYVTKAFELWNESISNIVS